MVSDIIKSIEAKFGKMSVTRGMDYVFLGMNIKFRRDGTLCILMKEYLEDAIDEFKKIGEDLVVTTTTPATKSLFVVNPYSEALGLDKTKTFHIITAK